MKKKNSKDEFYFNNLSKCLKLAESAVALLTEYLSDYDSSRAEEYIASMHDIEQKADARRHKFMSTVSEAFITPIEREDLLALSNYIDDIVDGIEDILRHIYIAKVSVIRDDLPAMLDVLKNSVAALRRLVREMPDFKHSKQIEKLIIEVNDLEEQGDGLYMNSMRRLYSEKDIREILVWKDIYDCIETCIDTCEHAADTVRTVVMKNL